MPPPAWDVILREMPWNDADELREFFRGCVERVTIPVEADHVDRFEWKLGLASRLREPLPARAGEIQSWRPRRLLYDSLRVRDGKHGSRGTRELPGPIAGFSREGLT